MVTRHSKPPRGTYPGGVTAQATNPLDSAVATTTVVNTTTETTVYTFTMPADTLIVAGKALRLEAVGDLLNNTGAPQTVQWAVRLGATAVLTTAAISLAASANRRSWALTAVLWAVDDNDQRAAGELRISQALTDTFAVQDQAAVGYGTATKDMTADQAIDLRATLGAASASLDIRLHAALLELIP